MFLSFMYACHGCCCLYFLHLLLWFFPTLFCSVMNLLNHECFGLMVNFMLLLGTIALSALSNSMLNWLLASSMVVSLLNSGSVKFWARVGPVIFVLSLIFLVLIGYFCFFMLLLTETIQWSKMNPCNVVLIMSKLLFSCLKIRPRVFLLTGVGLEMCCPRPSALIVSLKMIASALVRFYMDIKISQYDTILVLRYLFTSSSVMSSISIAFAVFCSQFGGGW